MPLTIEEFNKEIDNRAEIYKIAKAHAEEDPVGRKDILRLAEALLEDGENQKSLVKKMAKESVAQPPSDILLGNGKSVEDYSAMSSTVVSQTFSRKATVDDFPLEPEGEINDLLCANSLDSDQLYESVDFSPPINEEDREFFKVSEERLKGEIRSVVLNSSNIFSQDKWWEDKSLLDGVVEDLSSALLG